MNPDAFGIRARRRRTIAPQPPASVLLHGRTVNLAAYQWCQPGQPSFPAIVEKPVGSGLSPQPQTTPRLRSGLRPEKTGLVSCPEHGRKTNRRLWGLHPITNCETYGPVQSQLPSTPGKIYETALHIGVNEYDANVIAHLETLRALHEPAFRRRLEEPHPGALVRGTSDDGIELLANFSGQQQRGGGFVDLALNLGGGIFLIGAMLGEIL